MQVLKEASRHILAASSVASCNHGKESVLRREHVTIVETLHVRGIPECIYEIIELFITNFLVVIGLADIHPIGVRVFHLMTKIPHASVAERYARKCSHKHQYE